MPFLKLVFHFLLLALFNLAAIEAYSPVYIDHKCAINKNFLSNSTYQFNLNSLLSNLSSNVASTLDFYSATAGTNNAVYGVFICQGDIPHQICRDCVADATYRIVSECPHNKEAIIWYDVCLVRYSDRSFFSTHHELPTAKSLLSRAPQYRTEGTGKSGPEGTGKFETRDANLSGALDNKLNDVVVEAVESRVPGTMKLATIEDYPTFLRYNCSDNKNFTANDAYQNNLTRLNFSISSKIAKNTEFYINETIIGVQSDTTYGLIMCRGDVPLSLCRQCVHDAIQELYTMCPLSKEAIVWYDVCMFRYSNHSFFSTLNTVPRFTQYGADMPKDEQQGFNLLLSKTLDEVVTEAAKSDPTGAMKFATKEVSGVQELKKLYTLAQCTPDLSGQDCETCLLDAQQEIPYCCRGKQGGTLMYPNCLLRFELHQFYYNSSVVQEVPNGSQTTGKDKGQSQTIIIVVVLTVLSIMLFCFGYYCWRRMNGKSDKAILMENFGSEGTALESLQFTLAAIKAATNKFSVQNKIGKGGFGEVYKGILPDGREIAVKRLSKRSKQGAAEFNNEVLITSKLQHKNLVALLGFCLREEEKILVYEYVANKSLDYFLFGPQKEKALSWLERYRIIGGIARGILYLHEYSRHKVIHRDLKPSNILLDHKMNPKISDFGMAKMITTNEIEGNTNRIVGTYGYMSPEYAMFGQFSEKSDIFSYGVMVLEMISGKKNATCHDESQYADGFLHYAWKQWKDEKLLDIVDSNLAKVYSHSEIIRCIYIGLLCVQENPDARPSMATVVQYLSNDSIQLPIPQEPTHGQMEPTIRAMGDELANRSKSCSINEMSRSILFPR